MPAVTLDGHAMVGIESTGDPAFVLVADHNYFSKLVFPVGLNILKLCRCHPFAMQMFLSLV